jgi:hypothetical protein
VSLRRETRRLRRAFGALVLAMSPAAAAQACTTTGDLPTSADATADQTAAEASVVQGDDAADVADVVRLTDIDSACVAISEMRDADPDAAPDADPGCRYTLPCGLPDGSTFEIRGCGFYIANVAPGYDASLGCAVPEGPNCMNDVYIPAASGVITFECSDCFGGGGRRPVGLRSLPKDQGRAERPRSLGDYFAEMAHEEDASIHAFVRMRAELMHFGAPQSLVDGAERSARDEVRHTRMMARRARALGARCASARVRRPRRRSLEAMARENATEGCIHETFGALLMRWQASHASDPSLRKLFSRIAADETRHAALSWQLASWADARLDERSRGRVSAARQRALYMLRRKLSNGSGAPSRAIGQPTREEALALLDGMTALLGLG